MSLQSMSNDICSKKDKMFQTLIIFLLLCYRYVALSNVSKIYENFSEIVFEGKLLKLDSDICIINWINLKCVAL